MRLPVVRGIIDRRILVNYRVDPVVLARLLPPPFRPKLQNGFGMAGICLIRLRAVRPRYLPAWVGLSSENAAHRTAVEWDDQGTLRQGVYIRRRDTSSRLNALAGGKVFPGLHSHARFTVRETRDHLEVALRSDDGETEVDVAGDVMQGLPRGSIFASLAEASAFFEAGALGYSATPELGRYQGLELRCQQWQVESLGITRVRSSFFDDRRLFPAGSIELDDALLMRGIAHEWHAHADLCCPAPAHRSER